MRSQRFEVWFFWMANKSTWNHPSGINSAVKNTFPTLRHYALAQLQNHSPGFRLGSSLPTQLQIPGERPCPLRVAG